MKKDFRFIKIKVEEWERLNFIFAIFVVQNL